MKFLVLSAILYGPGTILYYLGAARAEASSVFTPDRVGHLRSSRSALCIVGIHGLATGYITI